MTSLQKRNASLRAAFNHDSAEPETLPVGGVAQVVKAADAWAKLHPNPLNPNRKRRLNHNPTDETLRLRAP